MHFSFIYLFVVGSLFAIQNTFVRKRFVNDSLFFSLLCVDREVALIETNMMVTNSYKVQINVMSRVVSLH